MFLPAETPSVRHFAITCNAEGKLANYPGVKVLKLDPRTNDSSLVMTSSFTNLVLAGLSLKYLPDLTEALTTIAAKAKRALPELERKAREIAANKCSRAIALVNVGSVNCQAMMNQQVARPGRDRHLS